MEKMLEEIEDYCRIEGMCDDDDDDDDNDNDDNNDNDNNMIMIQTFHIKSNIPLPPINIISD